jgi:hypothetical protein
MRVSAILYRAAKTGDQPLVASHTAQAKAFISYSRSDEAFAISLGQELEARGIEVLRDVEDTLPGEEWWRRLQSLIASADAIVFVLSRRSAESKVCRDEVAYGEELKKRIFPAVIEDVDWASVPPGLAARHSVFFKCEDQCAQSLEQLTQALLTDIDWTREHTRLYERAALWQRQGRGRYELLSGRALQEAERWLQSQPAGAEAPTALHLEYIKAGRDAATRRRNYLMASLAAGIVVSMASAAIALWQRGVAVEQEKIAVAESDKATRNLAVAKRTAERVVFDIAQGLRNVQGMNAHAVRTILETAHAAFDELAAQAPDDLDLQRPASSTVGISGATARRRWIVAHAYSWNHRRLLEAFQARGLVMPAAGLVTLSLHIVAELLADGEYITAFPSSWVRVSGLKVLPVDLPVRPWPVIILTLKNRLLSPVVERFIESMREATKAFAKSPGRVAHLSKPDVS